jgi:hypothetical protein
MKPRIDLQGAMRDALAAYRRYPWHFGLPFAVWELLWHVAGVGLHHLLHGRLDGVAWLTFPINLIVNSLITLLLADFLLTAQTGQQPRFDQVGRVLAYRGVFSYVLRLVVSFCLVEIGVVILYALFDLGLAAATGFHHVKGMVNTGTAADVVSGVALALSLVAMSLVTCRYSLAMQVFAVARGDRHRLFRFAVERALSLYGLLVQIELIESAPVVLVAVLKPVVRLYWIPADGVATAIEMVWTVALQAYYVCFVLVRVGLTTQLVRVPEAVEA